MKGVIIIYNKSVPESVVKYELIKEYFGNDTLMVMNYLGTLKKEELLEIKDNASLMIVENQLIDYVLKNIDNQL